MRIKKEKNSTITIVIWFTKTIVWKGNNVAKKKKIEIEDESFILISFKISRVKRKKVSKCILRWFASAIKIEISIERWIAWLAELPLHRRKRSTVLDLPFPLTGFGICISSSGHYYFTSLYLIFAYKCLTHSHCCQ